MPLPFQGVACPKASLVGNAPRCVLASFGLVGATSSLRPYKLCEIGLKVLAVFFGCSEDAAPTKPSDCADVVSAYLVTGTTTALVDTVSSPEIVYLAFALKGAARTQRLLSIRQEWEKLALFFCLVLLCQERGRSVSKFVLLTFYLPGAQRLPHCYSSIFTPT